MGPRVVLDFLQQPHSARVHRRLGSGVESLGLAVGKA